MKKQLLAPSLLSADFADLKGAINKIQNNGGSVVHIDVMDGSFVPEISYGQPVVRSLRPLTALPFDVHLMIENPERQIESFAKAGADWITFHYENTVGKAKEIIDSIHALGKKAGISVKPATSPSQIADLLPFVDVVLVMTVEPGFGGQKLIPECLSKAGEFNRLRSENGYSYLISVDGGVNEKTMEQVLSSGVDVIVSGSAFFKDAFKWEK